MVEVWSHATKLIESAWGLPWSPFLPSGRTAGLSVGR